MLGSKSKGHGQLEEVISWKRGIRCLFGEILIRYTEYNWNEEGMCNYSKVCFWPKIPPSISWHVDKLTENEQWKTMNTEHLVYSLTKIKTNFPRSRTVLFIYSNSCSRWPSLVWPTKLQLSPHTEI